MAVAPDLSSREGTVAAAEIGRRWVLLVLVAGVPVVFLRFTNDPFEVPKLALLTAGVAVAAALRVIEWLQGGRFKPPRLMLIPIASLLVPLSLAWIFAAYRYWSLFGEYKRFQGLFPYVVIAGFGLLVADSFGGRRHELAWPSLSLERSQVPTRWCNSWG